MIQKGYIELWKSRINAWGSRNPLSRCVKVTSHFPNQRWLSDMTPYLVTLSQWTRSSFIYIMAAHLLVQHKWNQWCYSANNIENLWKLHTSSCLWKLLFLVVWINRLTSQSEYLCCFWTGKDTYYEISFCLWCLLVVITIPFKSLLIDFPSKMLITFINTKWYLKNWHIF